jgi:integrase
MTLTHKPRRANRDGSVYFMTAQQRWAGAVTLPDGKRLVRTFKTEAEARRNLKDTLKQLDRGQIGLADARLKTSEYLLGWLDNVVKPTQKPLTHRTYETVVRGRLISALGRVKLKDLRPEHVESLQHKMLEQGLSINTISSMRTTLSAALSHAVERELIPLNVVSKVRLPRTNRPEDEDAAEQARVFDNDEIERFLAAAVGDRFEPMFRFMLSTALRPGEARGVRWQDIDLEQRVLQVRRQSWELKGGRRVLGSPKSRQGRRRIPLLSPALALLPAQQERVRFLRQTPGWQEHDLVFPDTDGRPVLARTVSLHMATIVRRAGLAHATPHTLRHSAGTFLLGAGVDERVVMNFLGHASTATTRLYQHVLPRMLTEAGEMLDEYFRAHGIMY